MASHVIKSFYSLRTSMLLEPGAQAFNHTFDISNTNKKYKARQNFRTNCMTYDLLYIGINILTKNVNIIKTLKEERILFLLMALFFVHVQNIDLFFKYYFDCNSPYTKTFTSNFYLHFNFFPKSSYGLVIHLGMSY